MRIYIYYFPEKTLDFNPLSLSKRERKSNYSMDNYFKDTLRAGPSKMDKAGVDRNVGLLFLQLSTSYVLTTQRGYSQDFQFFPPESAEL
jgi:SWI/SNF-related matrix-associated actin-dependent regulator of chromatin subfamily A member 5